MEQQVVELLLRLSYILFGVAIVGILVFSLLQLFQDFKSSLPTILGVIGIGLVFLVAYANTTAESATGEFGPGLINLASSGIMVVYFLGGLALVGIVLGEIWTSIK